MSPTTRTNTHQQRLGRVMDYIYDHLEDDISIDRLAEVAHLSPYHWHRIFTAMRGETVANTVKRLRLQRAAERLANSDQPIKDIAARAGYTAIESFTRAFKQAYAKSPADYRANGTHAAFKIALAAQGPDRFPVEVLDVPALSCAGVAHQGEYLGIDQAIGQLFAALAGLGALNQETRMLALFYDDPDLKAAAQLRSIGCATIDTTVELAAPVQAITIRGGLYARLNYQGPYADMKDAYRWLYGVWLPASGYDAADAPAFEEYLNNPQEVAPTELLTDIYLPLEALK